MANLLKHFVGQEGRKGGRSFGAAAGAEPPQLAACRYQKLVAAGPAFDAGETDGWFILRVSRWRAFATFKKLYLTSVSV
jgi:hypothetical protein